MKLKIALLLVSIPFLAFGGEGLYHFARNRQPTTLTCDELTRQIPRARWLRITGCEIDYNQAAWRDSGGQIKEMYFPVRPAGQVKTGPVALIAVTRDPQALAIAQPTIGDSRQYDQEAFLVMMLRIVTLLKAAREVEGYARGGFLERLQTRSELSGMNTPLADQYLALDLHARPTLMVPALETGAGAAALLAFLALVMRRRVPAPVTEPAAAETAVAPAQMAPTPVGPAPAGLVSPEAQELPDPWERAEFLEPLTRVELVDAATSPEAVQSSTPSLTPSDTTFLESLDALDGIAAAPAAEPVELEELPELPPAIQAADPAAPLDGEAPAMPVEPLEPRYPPMLVLNLPDTAGPEAIEQAPPLGPWPDVVRHLSEACGGIGFDENGRGLFEGTGFSVMVDVGESSPLPVWTVTIRARGPAALDATHRVGTRTGWRIFVPKHGAFLVVGRDETVVKL
jgi:hypothetical protein